MHSLPSLLLVLFCGVEVLSLSYPTTNTDGMIGYAKAGGVTGGGSGTVVEINSLEDLQTYISDSTAQILVINSDIKATTKTQLTLGSNKSIIGSYNKPTLYNIYLRDTSTSGNIIFQNLIFQHDVSINANDDIQLYLYQGTKYWIDHCSFIGHTWSDDDGSLDKLLYVGAVADYVTLSNSYFGNHKYGVILGYPEDSSSTEYNTRMTICNNHFENLEVRAPGLMRWGHYHVFNNYINEYHQGFTIATNANIVSENNYFESSNTNSAPLDDKGTGKFTDSGSVPTITGQTSAAADWTASSQYDYTLQTAEEAKSSVPTKAGAQTATLAF